jgi:hypothetical protein
VIKGKVFMAYMRAPGAISGIERDLAFQNRHIVSIHDR